MTARSVATLSPAIDLDAAHDHLAATAVAPSAVGRVGLELEFHVVDTTTPQRRPRSEEVAAVITDAGAMPHGSAITMEPGGQLELSGPPATDITSAIAALRADERALSRATAKHGLGLAPIGADPARPLSRITRVSRYAAMEQHFAAMGCGLAGRRMMSSTAALQINLEAGLPHEVAERIAHLHLLGPVLSAIAACSPMIAGESSGWASMREQAWRGIALAAPVMLIRDSDGADATAVTSVVSLAHWIRHPDSLGRAATVDDIDYHLTTLFPPVRLRGYLEVRFLDAVPDRWWPALAAIAVTLVDDPAAAAAARRVCARASIPWELAARDGLRDAAVHAAARRCLGVAVEHCPEVLRPDVEAYAELVDRGRTPGHDLRDRIRSVGAVDALAEAAAGGGQDA
jgi:glutamate--cysteine ligase